MLSSRLVLALGLSLLPAHLTASEMKVAIRTDFPGGNVLVVKADGATVHLAPDLRGGPAWFYWHLEAEATQAGTVNFVFANPPMIGVRGPAISRDGGRSWQWLGAEHVKFAPAAGKDKTPRHDSFSFAFTEAKQKVRFAVAIPYVQRNLDEFLDSHKANPLLTRSTLTETRIGRRPVNLLQIGKPGPGVHSVLMTARHHACESMASYVLEGIMHEALSDSPAGAEFRKKYVLYVVPIVDVDGVERGDQGKNRLPRDYNRDYGPDTMHPEILAIKELAKQKNVQFTLDLHCPFLRGDIHEAFYFVGLGLPHIKNNLVEWNAWLKEERPQVAMAPLDLLTDPRKPKAADPRINSHYFATKNSSIFAICLEVPYAQPTCPLDAAMARAYGVSMLKAWVRTRFLPANDEVGRDGDDYASLLTLRSKFIKIYRSNPKEAEALAISVLDAKSATHRAEANNLMALLRLQQRRFPEARRFNDAVNKLPGTTNQQKATAALVRMQILCSDPTSKENDVEACLAEVQRLPYPSLEHQAKVFEAVSDYFVKKQAYVKSLGYTRKQFDVAAGFEKGKLLNRMATFHDLLQRPEDAVACRMEAVKILRGRLGPVPERSIFGANMTVDLFDALLGIPNATLDEKRAAAAMVLNHEIVSAASKDRVRKTMAILEKSK